jgi:hypothetical protein
MARPLSRTELDKLLAEIEALRTRPPLFSSRSLLKLAPASLFHGGILLLRKPDLSIGRGLPPLQVQHASGHCPYSARVDQLWGAVVHKRGPLVGRGRKASASSFTSLNCLAGGLEYELIVGAP